MFHILPYIRHEKRLLRRNFSDISKDAREHVLRNKLVEEEDQAKSQGLGGDSILDHVLQNIEKKVRTLQLRKWEAIENDDLSSYLCRNNVWRSLNDKHSNLIRFLVNDTINDWIFIDASLEWQSCLEEWGQSLKTFENSLNDTVQWQKDKNTFLAGNRVLNSEENEGKDTAEVDDKMILSNVSVDERLFINLLTENIVTRNGQWYANIIPSSISCIKTIDANIKNLCVEIWEIIISICGTVRRKTSLSEESAKTILRQTILNSVVCLEKMCQRQILLQLKQKPGAVCNGKYPYSSLTEGLSNDELTFEYIRSFCIQEKDEPVIVWGSLSQLLYWSVRVGSLGALTAFVQYLEERNIKKQHKQFLMHLSKIFISKFIQRNKHYESDNCWEQNTRMEKKYAEYDSNALSSFLEYSDEMSLSIVLKDPIITILISLVQPTNAPVPLKTLMPNATAEDFIWYNLSLILRESDLKFTESIERLQSRIVSLGPTHFGYQCDDSPENWSYAKIVCLVLAPNVAIDWLLTIKPHLTNICIHWAVYLYQYGFSGSPESLTNYFFSKLAKYAGAVSLDKMYQELFVTSSRADPFASILYCELLPYVSRISVVSSIVETFESQFISNIADVPLLIGQVEKDGSCRGSALYKTLIAKSWEDLEDWQREEYTVKAKMTYDQLIASLAETAAEKGYFVAAAYFSYIIGQDRVSIKFLIKSTTDRSTFPVMRTPLTKQLLLQKEAQKLFEIFKAKVEYEQRDLDQAFEILKVSWNILEIYAFSNKGDFKRLWNFFNKSPIFSKLNPCQNLVEQWEHTELFPHIPSLIDIYARCLETVVTANSSEMSILHYKADIENLLVRIAEIERKGFPVNPSTTASLRKLVSSI